MKLYTKTGDRGKTSLIGGRADKDHLRVEAYGTLDEANSFIGLAQSYLKAEEALFHDILSELTAIQHELFDCGSDLAHVNVQEEGKLKAESITMLEERIDAYVEEAPLPSLFFRAEQKRHHFCMRRERSSEELNERLSLWPKKKTFRRLRCHTSTGCPIIYLRRRALSITVSGKWMSNMNEALMYSGQRKNHE